MTLKIAEVRTDSEGEVWDQYVLKHPMATGYHLLAWRRIMEEVLGHRTFYLMTTAGHGEVQGLLPLVFLSSRFFGRSFVSMPFFTYGGLLTETADAQTELLKVAVSLAQEHKVTHIEFRHQELFNLEWPSKQERVSMRLSLPKEFEALWASFPSKLRSQIRRAQKEGMTARIGGRELLGDFYQVFSRNMRDLGTPVYARTFFKMILQTFPKEARICAIYANDQLMAAGFLYGFRKMLDIPWASSDRRYNHLAPNMLLYSSVLEYACQQGFQVFDFGRSTPGTGTYRFKEQWGAKPIQLHWHYWVEEGGLPPGLNPQKTKYRAAVKIWQKLPIALTQMLGPFIRVHLDL